MTEERQTILCIAGKPASGKTLLATTLAGMGWSMIEASDVISELLGSKRVRDLPPTKQIQYRREALSLISGPRPQKLSLALVKHIRKLDTPVVVSGVRRLSTLDDLKDAGIKPILIYVDADYHTCRDRYMMRGGEHLDYQSLLRDPIERFWIMLFDNADEKIENNSSLADMQQAAVYLHDKYSPLCA